MSNSNDESTRYKENRHVFYNPPSEKAGVSTEFAYNGVLGPVNNLSEKLEKALSLKRDDPHYQNAAKLLQTCSARIGTTLGIRQVEPVQTEKPTVDTDSSTLRNR